MSPRIARTAAAIAAALVAFAFAAALALVPSSERAPRAAELAVGDPYAGGRIVDLRWTADRSRLVAVTQRGESLAVQAVTPDGHRRYVAGHVIGELDLYPAPSGPRVAIVRTRRNLRSRVAVIDVTGPREIWWRWAPGPATVRWDAAMETVAIAGSGACNVVSAHDGQLLPDATCAPT